MFSPILYHTRDIYGCITAADFAQNFGAHTLYRHVRSTKQLAFVLLQTGSSDRLMNAAWRRAVQDGNVAPSHVFRHGDTLDCRTIQAAQKDAAVLDGYISTMVNNPRSAFYIYG